jgi:hypothetical protein
MYEMVKKLTSTETIKLKLNRLRWFGHIKRMEENIIPNKVLYLNSETTRLTGRPRIRWQDDVMEDGRLFGLKWWKEGVYNRDEWKKLLRTARNRRILHMPVE